MGAQTDLGGPGLHAAGPGRVLRRRWRHVQHGQARHLGGRPQRHWYVTEAAKTAPKFMKWEHRHLPKGPGGRFALGSTDGWALYKGTKNKDAAWGFTYYLTQDYYQKLNVIDYQMQLAPRRSQFKLFRGRRSSLDRTRGWISASSSRPWKWAIRVRRRPSSSSKRRR